MDQILKLISDIGAPLTIAVIFSLCIIWLSKKAFNTIDNQRDDFFMLTSNNLTHLTDAIEKQTLSIEKLITRLDTYFSVINDLLDAVYVNRADKHGK
ncbi:MAG: hypothetical protein AABY22_36425 [Nanoarchaeota archaeon]